MVTKMGSHTFGENKLFENTKNAKRRQNGFSHMLVKTNTCKLQKEKKCTNPSKGRCHS